MSKVIYDTKILFIHCWLTGVISVERFLADFTLKIMQVTCM